MRRFRLCAAIFTVVAASAGLEGQTCQPLAGTDVLSEGNPSVNLADNFCLGDPGFPFCDSGYDGTFVELRLSGRFGVSLTCSFSDPVFTAPGKLCVTHGNCEQSQQISRPTGEEHVVMLQGDFPDTSLRLLVLDKTGAQVCSGEQATVSCSGQSWGTTDGGPPPPPPPPPADPIFRSGFEVADLSDWTDRVCPACSAATGSLQEGGSALPFGRPFRAQAHGEHLGHLAGPSGTDFDLVLEQLQGSQWVPVARGISPGSTEGVSYSGEQGLYRWKVMAVSGSGGFELVVYQPGMPDSNSNRLVQSEAASKNGRYGLESLYVPARRNRDFLVHDLPTRAKRYEVSFFVNPAQDLAVVGTQHQVFQARKGGMVLIKGFLLSPEEGGGHRLAFQVRRGNGQFTPREYVELSDDRFRKVRLVWQAASSPTMGDGFFYVFRGAKIISIDGLANHTHWVSRELFGQVTAGNRQTAGWVYFDNFLSKWEP